MATSHISFAEIFAVSQQYNFGLEYWISLIIYHFETISFDVDIIQSKAEYLKRWVLYTHLNYQMISMAKFYDIFLNI